MQLQQLNLDTASLEVKRTYVPFIADFETLSLVCMIDHVAFSRASVSKHVSFSRTFGGHGIGAAIGIQAGSILRPHPIRARLQATNRGLRSNSEKALRRKAIDSPSVSISLPFLALFTCRASPISPRGPAGKAPEEPKRKDHVCRAQYHLPVSSCIE